MYCSSFGQQVRIVFVCLNNKFGECLLESGFPGTHIRQYKKTPRFNSNFINSPLMGYGSENVYVLAHMHTILITLLGRRRIRLAQRT